MITRRKLQRYRWCSCERDYHSISPRLNPSRHRRNFLRREICYCAFGCKVVSRGLHVCRSKSKGQLLRCNCCCSIAIIGVVMGLGVRLSQVSSCSNSGICGLSNNLQNQNLFSKFCSILTSWWKTSFSWKNVEFAMNKKITNYVLNFHEKKLLESGRIFPAFRDNSMFFKLRTRIWVQSQLVPDWNCRQRFSFRLRKKNILNVLNEKMYTKSNPSGASWTNLNRSSIRIHEVIHWDKPERSDVFRSRSFSLSVSCALEKFSRMEV